jgi:hypothetical protein
MKSVNKIIAAILLLVSMQSNAFILNASKEQLANKMAESKNIKLFIEQRMRTLFDMYAESFAASAVDKKKFKEAAEKQFLTSLETSKAIELEFPAFCSLNETERKEIYELILKTPAIAVSVKTAIKCVGASILGGVICQFGAMAVTQTWFWGGCMFSCIAADIGACVLSAGAILPAITLLAISEASSCWAVATGSTLAFTGSTITGNCLTGATGGLGACFGLSN